MPLQEEIQKYFSRKVKIANDADCAALGEVTAGAASGYRNAIMVTLGTGVGGGISCQGDYLLKPLKKKIYEETFAANEIGIPELIVVSLGNGGGSPSLCHS